MGTQHRFTARQQATAFTLCARVIDRLQHLDPARFGTPGPVAPMHAQRRAVTALLGDLPLSEHVAALATYHYTFDAAAKSLLDAHERRTGRRHEEVQTVISEDGEHFQRIAIIHSVAPLADVYVTFRRWADGRRLKVTTADLDCLRAHIDNAAESLVESIRKSALTPENRRLAEAMHLACSLIDTTDECIETPAFSDDPHSWHVWAFRNWKTMSEAGVHERIRMAQQQWPAATAFFNTLSQYDGSLRARENQRGTVSTVALAWEQVVAEVGNHAEDFDLGVLVSHATTTNDVKRLWSTKTIVAAAVEYEAEHSLRLTPPSPVSLQQLTDN